jgi:exopolysaccharide biosynthesis polyprenyl glycosylphosphotransferase
MLRRYSVNFALFSIYLDLVSICAALYIAYIVHPWVEIFMPFIKSVGNHEIPGVFYVIFPIAWVCLNIAFSLYDGHLNWGFINEISRLVLSTLITSISLAGLLFFLCPNFVHSIFASFILNAAIWMGLWRVAVRLYWRYQYSNRRELRRVLVIGAGKMGRQVAADFSGQNHPNMQVIGFLDDNFEKLEQNGDILGTTKDLEGVVKSHNINIIIIALPSDAFGITCDIVDRLRLTPVKIWIVPDANRLARYHSNVEYLADTPVLDVRAPAISERQRLAKRLFDLVISSVILTVTAPLILIISVLIKLDSPGPIFFRQKRIGENMQPFNMIKFRTMVQNAESLCSHVETKDEQGNLIHKHRGDPRVTRIGHFLRRYSLDEIPQFFNVLVGNMSVVGPRPELPYLVEKYKGWQYVRFTIPQGITGWWQVNGRSDKPLHLNTEADFYYIKNYSFWLDLMIIFKTINAVVTGAGAF